MKYNLKMLPEVQENGANSTKNNSSIIAEARKATLIF